jgi:hypothetical protein
LPELLKYYGQINRISEESFSVTEVAKSELEWWIIRRYRQEHPPEEWQKYLEMEAGEIYHLLPEKFSDYSKLRVEAMLFRDSKGDNIKPEDWQQINQLLEKAWTSFIRQLENKPA